MRPSSKWLGILSKSTRMAAALSFFACSSVGSSASSSHSPTKELSTPRSPKGHFISIDGLNPAHLQVLLDRGKLTAPHGFKWLEDHTLHVKRLEPVFTTLTAASHISTITCSTPAQHGIIANNYFTEGQKVSGYTSEFKSESLWEAAKRQNKKVIALAYVGADAQSPKREADYGLAYPEDKYLGRAQTLNWTVDAMPAATNWTAPAGVPLADARNQDLEIAVDASTDEKLTVHALVIPRVIPGVPGSNLIYLDTDKDLTNGFIGQVQQGNLALPTYVHHYFTETNASALLYNHKRTVFFRSLPASPGQVSLYVSASSYNNAYPAAFREALDKANMVWPNYGVSSDKLTPKEKIEANAIFDRFLTRVATFAKTNFAYDMVLFYQPLIDTLGHSYEGLLPLPFNPDATDDISQAYVLAFQIIDQNLSDLLSDMRPEDVVELMGDHGMDPIKKAVNVAALLPQAARSKIDVIASGTLVLVYPKQTNAAGQVALPTEDQKAAADAVGQELYAQLKDLQFEGQPVFGTAHRQSPRAIYGAESPSAYGTDWQFGDALWTFTGATHFWLRYNEIDAATFAEPPAHGMHGNFINLSTMDTTGYIGAPGIAKSTLARDRLLDMVPTFTGLLGMEAPRNCQGHSILGSAQ